MSRSYKKTPICKHPRHGSNKAARTYANRLYRHKMNREINIEETAASTKKNSYRRYYDSWDIADYISYEPIAWAKMTHKRYKKGAELNENKDKKWLFHFYEKYAAMTEEEYLNKYWYPYFYRR